MCVTNPSVIVAISQVSENVYTFQMPDEVLHITVSFKEAAKKSNKQKNGDSSKGGLGVGAIIAICVGSLAVIYGAFYIFWKKAVFKFMNNKVCNAMFNWFDKYVIKSCATAYKKTVEFFKKLFSKKSK